MLIITISPLGEEGTEIIEGHTGNVKPARRSVMVTMAMRILTLDICTYLLISLWCNFYSSYFSLFVRDENDKRKYRNNQNRPIVVQCQPTDVNHDWFNEILLVLGKPYPTVMRQ